MTASAARIDCQRVEAGDALFDGAVDLCDRVLREPLGRPSAREDGERDLPGVHFAAVKAGRVVGCLALYPDGAGAALLTSMAVAPEARGEGVGATVYRYAENWARARGVARIFAEARVDALGFYEACGFAAEGEVYMGHGISHRKVSKSLTKGAP
jgi:GNAT superfamily N-acetyltransferase